MNKKKVSMAAVLVTGLLLAGLGCSSSSSSSGNSVAAAIGGLPDAQLSAGQNDSIVVTALWQVIPGSPLSNYSNAGYVITDEAESADPLLRYEMILNSFIEILYSDFRILNKSIFLNLLLLRDKR